MALRAMLMAAVGLVSGSLMFSTWLARLAGADVRRVGDGNPGAVNAFKAAGPVVGSLALLLDFLKGWLPVAAAYWLLGIRGWWLAAVIVAPVLGHAFSPFLRFHGGKAITVTFGVWSGVTLWEAPCMLGGVLALCKLVFRLRDDWSTLVALALLVAYLLWRHPEPALVAAWAANTAIVAAKHLKLRSAS
ncbi:glycerol-3-phosphate acyltransferase [candidate division WOR-3 bacterium]|nr:glycerol-3-phosphate acyltransferase [candidate division WOR-3 bacterium]